MEVLPPSFVAAQKKTYTLTINRASRNASDDARLSSLSLSDGMLMRTLDDAGMPAWQRCTEAEYPSPIYSQSGQQRRESYGHGGSHEQRCDGIYNPIMDSSVSGGAVDLIVGPNVIDITVTAEDRTTTKYYQVTVTRVAATASSNADLIGFDVWQCLQ